MFSLISVELYWLCHLPPAPSPAAVQPCLAHYNSNMGDIPRPTYLNNTCRALVLTFKKV